MSCTNVTPTDARAGSLKHHRLNIGQMSHYQRARNPSTSETILMIVLLLKKLSSYRNEKFGSFTEEKQAKKQTSSKTRKQKTDPTFESEINCNYTGENLGSINVPAHPKGPEDACEAARHMSRGNEGKAEHF